MSRGAYSPRNWHARDDEPSDHGVSSPSPERTDWRDEIVAYGRCATCQRPFPIARGEREYAEQHPGVQLPDRCCWHRPTRREQLAMAAALNGIASLEPAATKPRQEPHRRTGSQIEFEGS